MKTLVEAVRQFSLCHTDWQMAYCFDHLPNKRRPRLDIVLIWWNFLFTKSQKVQGIQLSVTRFNVKIDIEKAIESFPKKIETKLENREIGKLLNDRQVRPRWSESQPLLLREGFQGESWSLPKSENFDLAELSVTKQRSNEDMMDQMKLIHAKNLYLEAYSILLYYSTIFILWI